ncbi:MAG: zinc ribbon domain-containing protein [Nitrososphaerota archaeon]|nr:zinc ribbon domain-containing protein [Nitrososphaerota archaeon]
MTCCVKCGKEIGPDLRFCTACGQPVPTDDAQFRQTSNQTNDIDRINASKSAAPATPVRTVYCSKCGKLASPELAFCTACGSPLQDQLQNQEFYIGGFSSENLKKGSIAGYAMYVTNRRIFGMQKRAGVIAGSAIGAAAGQAVGPGAMGLGYAAGASATNKSNLPLLAELEEKCDFQISKDDIARIELTAPFYMNGGSMVIYKKNGEQLGVDILNSGAAEYRQLTNLLSKFLDANPIAVQPKQLLPAGKLFLVQNPNSVSGAKRRFSKSFAYFLFGLALIPVLGSFVAGTYLIGSAIIAGWSIGAAIAGLLIFGFGLVWLKVMFRGGRRGTWKTFLVIFVIALAISGFALLENNGGASLLSRPSQTVHIVTGSSYCFNPGGNNFDCTVLLTSKSGSLSTSDISTVTINGVSAQFVAAPKNGEVGIVAGVTSPEASSLTSATVIVYLSDGSTVSAKLGTS